MEIMAKRIRELRQEKGLSMEKLAKILNVSNAIICKWENNISEPTASNIISLADYFNVSADYLLGRQD